MIMKETHTIKILDKIDELLYLRESKIDALRNLSITIKQGIQLVKELPKRWYVKNPSDAVIKYLEKKYNRDLSQYSEYPLPIGLGEMYGEFAFIPHDVSYSWEITEEEFNFALTVINQE